MGWDGSLLSGAGRGGWITGMDLFLPTSRSAKLQPEGTFLIRQTKFTPAGRGMDRGALKVVPHPICRQRKGIEMMSNSGKCGFVGVGDAIAIGIRSANPPLRTKES